MTLRPFFKRIVIAAGAALLFLSASGCEKATVSQGQPVTDSFFCMDTYFTLSAYGPHAESGLSAARKELERIDALLSAENPDSDISSLGRAAARDDSGAITVSPETAGLIARALDIAWETDGAFNISLYPISRLWGFPEKKYRVPEKEEIDALLPFCDLSGLSADPKSGAITLPAGMQIDLGAIGKGYASSRAVAVLQEEEVSSALVNLGGNVQALGAKPDGSDWRIGVQDPEDAKKVLAVVSLKDKAVITSGAYERYFERNGVRYHHILDPGTGYPAESDLLSVTIISSDATMADALSTALFVMGSEKAADFWRQRAGSFDLILYTKEHRLMASEGITGSLRSDLEVGTISR